MTNRNATTTEVRNLYKERGDTVRISKDGHVTYKAGGEGPWLEGRWVEEYHFDADLGVYCR